MKLLIFLGDVLWYVSLLSHYGIAMIMKNFFLLFFKKK